MEHYIKTRNVIKTCTLFAVLILFIVACGGPKDSSSKDSESNRTIYHGGEIITMEGTQPTYVDAVVQEDGKIVFTGSLDDAIASYGDRAKKHDLKGATMMPGFIEPHAHPVSIGAFILSNDIVAPHEWRMPHKTYPGVSGNKEYLSALKETIDSKTDKSKTVMIWGYHKSWHGDLTLKDLDSVSGAVPTVIWQRSTHEIYLNTACANKYNITEADIAEPEQTDWENLHFWERAYQDLKGKKLNSFFSDQTMLKLGIKRMSKMMLQNGLVAMSEPSFPNSSFDVEYEILKAETDIANSYGMYLIPGFPEQFVLGMTNEAYQKRVDSLPMYNTEHIKFMPKQYKTFGDGAIYSLALQLRDGFEGCNDCHAEWIIPPEPAQQIFDYWWDADYKVHIHITGDLAFETYLDFVEAAHKRYPRDHHRTTFHHIGLFDAEQADRAARLGIEMSANPYYLWALADKYSETGLGAERASNMVALKELTDRNIPVSLHSDFAMAPADPLMLAWAAINRVVASGEKMNPALGISVYSGMKGITFDAARTFEMEDELGSIKTGKQASFTILRDNPFKIDPIDIKDIDIKGVVYKGRYITNE